STPDLQNTINGLFTWSSGLIFGSGDDPSKLIKHLPVREKIFFDIPAFTTDFFKAAILPTGSSFEIWERLYIKNFEVLKSFLQKVEDLTSTPEFVKRSLGSFEKLFFHIADFSSSKIIGSTLGTLIDITQEINHLTTEKHIEKVIIKIKAGEKVFGNIELPVINGFVHKYVIKDAVAENYAWQILGEFFKENIYKKLSLSRLIGLKIRMSQHKQKIHKSSANYYEKLHDFIGWAIFLQETFNKRYWISKRFYLPARQLKFVQTIIQKHDPVSIEIGNEIPNIRLLKDEITLIITAGGNACAKIKINHGKKFLRAQEIRSIIIKELGYELCKIIVREILLEEELKEKISLQKKIRNKYQKNVQQLPPEKQLFNSYDISDEIKKITVDGEKAAIIPRRNSLFSDDSSARFALLPTDTGVDSSEYYNTDGKKIRAFKNDWERKILNKSDELEYLLYSPNVINAEELGLILDTNRSQSTKPQKNALRKLTGNTRDLPVLMYHSVAPSGSDLMSPYRISPVEFENQMQYLYKEGYHTVSFEEWYAAVKLNTPLPGKAVILTFDDGYLDFYNNAFPILTKYSFSAYNFIVTDFVNNVNAWDQKLGEEIPLMTWEHIHELNGKGIKFGSHTSNHKPLTALDPGQLACQFLNSLKTLKDHLRNHINSVAYPYGDYDPVVKHLAGACGFTFALTCEDGKCNKFSELLALPRIEISGFDTFESFIQKVESTPIYPE
ncbi:MAG: polysaccharide deacetylase family protein, partial [Ignavibacteria bacterium]